jgi:hypothetical protein
VGLIDSYSYFEVGSVPIPGNSEKRQYQPQAPDENPYYYPAVRSMIVREENEQDDDDDDDDDDTTVRRIIDDVLLNGSDSLGPARHPPLSPEVYEYLVELLRFDDRREGDGTDNDAGRWGDATGTLEDTIAAFLAGEMFDDDGAARVGREPPSKVLASQIVGRVAAAAKGVSSASAAACATANAPRNAAVAFRNEEASFSLKAAAALSPPTGDDSADYGGIVNLVDGSREGSPNVASEAPPPAAAKAGGRGAAVHRRRKLRKGQGSAAEPCVPAVGGDGDDHDSDHAVDNDDFASAWRECQEHEQAWGGRGKGGRGEYAGAVNSIPVQRSPQQCDARAAQRRGAAVQLDYGHCQRSLLRVAGTERGRKDHSAEPDR